MNHRPSRMISLQLAVLSLMSFLCACPSSKPRTPKARLRTTLKTRLFTESAAVRALTAVQGSLWVGTSNGLIRWNIQNKTAETINSDDGLPGDEILALAPDARNGLWVATSGGVTRYDGKTWRLFGNCPLGSDIQAIAPSEDGSSVWVGGGKGLARFIMGHWSMVEKGVGITSLIIATTGAAIWAGTDQGKVLHCTPAGCKKESRDQGLTMERISDLAYSDVGLLALGSNAQGDLLAVRDDHRWYTYRPSPARLLGWAKFAMGKMYLAAGDKIFRLARDRTGTCRNPPFTLTSSDPKAPRYCVHSLAIPVPSHITQVAAAMGVLWLGTQNLGLSRYDGTRYVLYRTSDLARNAKNLSVACQGPIYCFMANGASAFRFDGSEWTPLDRLVGIEGGRVLYVLNGPSDRVTAIVRNDLGRLQIVDHQNDSWTVRPTKTPIAAPRPLTVTAADYSSAGSLWLGLAQMDSNGDLVPFGAMEVTAAGDVIPHRNFQGQGQIDERSLSLPNDISTILAQGSTVWLGTSTGLCRVSIDHRLHCYEENSGLPSPVVTDLAIAPGRGLWVATAEGLALFTGGRFRGIPLDVVDSNPRSIVDMGGTLWMGTAEGLVARNITGTTKVYDDDAGLLETRIEALAEDGKHRLWILHPSGLTLVNP